MAAPPPPPPAPKQQAHSKPSAPQAHQAAPKAQGKDTTVRPPARPAGGATRRQGPVTAAHEGHEAEEADAGLPFTFSQLAPALGAGAGAGLGAGMGVQDLATGVLAENTMDFLAALDPSVFAAAQSMAPPSAVGGAASVAPTSIPMTIPKKPRTTAGGDGSPVMPLPGWAQRLAAAAGSDAKRQADTLHAIQKLTSSPRKVAGQAMRGIHEAANALAARENRSIDQISVLIGKTPRLPSSCLLLFAHSPVFLLCSVAGGTAPMHSHSARIPTAAAYGQAQGQGEVELLDDSGVDFEFDG